MYRRIISHSSFAERKYEIRKSSQRSTSVPFGVCASCECGLKILRRDQCLLPRGGGNATSGNYRSAGAPDVHTLRPPLPTLHPLRCRSSWAGGEWTTTNGETTPEISYLFGTGHFSPGLLSGRRFKIDIWPRRATRLNE